MLDFLANKIGAHISTTYAFGIGILLTTIVIRLLFFPLMYNMSKMSAKMRVFAPKMKEIQERYAADPQKQQQEMMNLYKTEKINPVSGCLPMLLQIPVFIALVKTLSVTIEMRHAPFFGWVHDLSAPDPAMLFNLFGLIPWDPRTVPLIGSFLGIGLWPILYGISMSAQQALSPPPPDPMQARIFRWLPVIFTMTLAGLPAGLLIYYTWSYSLLILQQYVILRQQGVDTPFDQFIKKRFGRSDKDKIDGP
jgi:YidC/Oxa1 family membrane protein insertase